ncbi:MAG: DUF2723 domain-containing protein [Deltaproteobacteria bacterium]|nr:DUF2723 domain-containing protein [Deltaproteobacteria bacterium]MBW2018475.1 DUF2723 domain-containing protein [Deltaproteobacteria bacterium]MBW2074132.1 DUF2723 domain-containing protein [Deltaproteobacteria bacterium]
METKNPKNRHYERDISLGLLAFIVSFWVYLLTVSPTVYLGDSGEYTAAAFALGNPHIGYPVYCLLGKIFSLLPLGNVAFRLNLMSSFFASFTVLLIYFVIYVLTLSRIAAFSASILLAFSPTFWSQSVSAEVYTLHTFFVALLVLVLIRWYETNSFKTLMCFAFMVALSFGNHIQTVMLAPAVLCLIIWIDRKAILNLHNLLILLFLFFLGLSVYIYLPVRTEAGVAVHCGTPNKIESFVNLVTAAHYRPGLTLSKNIPFYMERAKQALLLVASQYLGLGALAVLGFFSNIISSKWKIFCLLLILFDIFYTVCLNEVSLEITGFNLPASMVIAILIGTGMAYCMKLLRGRFGSGPLVQNVLTSCFLILPVVPLIQNFPLNDQSKNYLGYEYNINVFRTVPAGATLVVGDDNIVFPCLYLRCAENARPDLSIHDRYNLYFKMPFPKGLKSPYVGKWLDLRSIIEEELARTKPNLYMALFNPAGISIPNYVPAPFGLVYHILRFDQLHHMKTSRNIWSYYISKSVFETMSRDYLNRSVSGSFLYKFGRDLIFAGHQRHGLAMMQMASELAYNDEALHAELGLFFTDRAMYEIAFQELALGLRYTKNPAAVYNYLGYYYSKKGDIPQAIQAFQRSISLDPAQVSPLNNLGLMYLQMKKRQEAKEVFAQSLQIKRDQPQLKRFILEQGL